MRISDKEAMAWRTFSLPRTSEPLSSIFERMVHDIPATTSAMFVLRGSVLGGHAPATRSRASGEPTCRWGVLPSRARLNPRPSAWRWRRPRAIGVDEMAGVDLIPDLDQGRLVVLEVNAVPGWHALARVTGIDVAAAILAALRDTVR